MSSPTFLESLSDKLQRSATVKAIYGDPIEAGGRTVIPVARISYGLGGGFGTGSANHGKKQNAEQPAGHGEGGGGGGGVTVTPLGIVEITQERTRYLPIRSGKGASAGAFLAGFIAGMLLGKRRR